MIDFVDWISLGVIGICFLGIAFTIIDANGVPFTRSTLDPAAPAGSGMRPFIVYDSNYTKTVDPRIESISLVDQLTAQGFEIKAFTFDIPQDPFVNITRPDAADDSHTLPEVERH